MKPDDIIQRHEILLKIYNPLNDANNKKRWVSLKQFPFSSVYVMVSFCLQKNEL